MQIKEDKKTSQYVLRPMTPADLDEIMAIERASFAMPWTRDQFEREIENPVSYPYTLMVMDESGKMKLGAYIIFWIVYDEAHILDIAVRPGLRRRGVATWLFEHVLKMLKEAYVRGVFLEVRRSNSAAINLYKKFGFRETYERKKYYGDEDALVMTLVF